MQEPAGSYIPKTLWLAGQNPDSWFSPWNGEIAGIGRTLQEREMNGAEVTEV